MTILLQNIVGFAFTALIFWLGVMNVPRDHYPKFPLRSLWDQQLMQVNLLEQ